jgi:hypothetical protein
VDGALRCSDRGTGWVEVQAPTRTLRVERATRGVALLRLACDDEHVRTVDHQSPCDHQADAAAAPCNVAQLSSSGFGVLARAQGSNSHHLQPHHTTTLRLSVLITLSVSPHTAPSASPSSLAQHTVSSGGSTALSALGAGPFARACDDRRLALHVEQILYGQLHSGESGLDTSQA